VKNDYADFMKGVLVLVRWRSVLFSQGTRRI
jgi:hypothetical protein